VDKVRVHSAAAFASDEDVPTLTAQELASFRRVNAKK
jgi:hypothetical protein